jgi:PIN domain nuclease of toxin-antitoxin system
VTNLLLDTHAFIWYSKDDSKLPESIKIEIETAVGEASPWRIEFALVLLVSGKLRLN